MLDININIKHWDESYRPREKSVKKCKNNVLDAELIAILIGSWNRQDSAV